MPLDNFGVVAIRAVSAPQPTYMLRSAQPDDNGIASLASLVGFRSLVSYRLSGANEGPVSFADEAAAITKRGGRCICDPRLHNGMHPDVATLKVIAKDVNSILVGGESVLVHCLHGRERTGAVVAAWSMMFGGWSLDAVERDLARYGVHGLTALFDHEVVEAVHALAKELGL